MFINYNSNPLDAKSYDTTRLRDEFLTDNLFTEDSVNMVYSHIDRVVAIGVSSTSAALKLDDFVDKKAFGTDYFLERRELGIVNLGGEVSIIIKGNQFTLQYLDALYLGKSKK